MSNRGTYARPIALLGSLGLLLLAQSARAAGATPNHVRDVKVHTAAGAAGATDTDIEVVGTEAPSFIVRAEDGGKRLIVELANADVAGAPAALTESKGSVTGVLTQAYKTDSGSMTRLTVNLATDAAYRVRADGTTLHISLSKGSPPAPVAAPVVAADNVDSELKGVRFERTAAGKDRVIVALTDMPTYALSTTPSGKVRLELRGTKVPDTLLRTLDVGGYRGALKTVSTFVDAKAGTAIVEIDRAGDTQGEVSIEEGRIIWSFEVPKGAQGQTVAQGASSAVRHTVTVAREEEVATTRVETSIHDADGTAEHLTGGSQAGFTSSIPMQAAGRYTGRRIDLDLKDADIHNILRLLADVGRVNIVTADDVSGSVTIRMRNVPWDQALDVVLQAKTLGMSRQGNLIRVAPLGVLQKERELETARHKQELDLAPLETRLIPVSYASAEELQARAKDLLSSRGSLAVDERTNVLIARDVGGNLNHVEELIRSLDTQTPQVLIEARIVEATSKYLRDVGIQWGGDGTFSQATGNPTGIAFPSNVTVAGGAYDGQTPKAGLSPISPTVAVPNFAVNMPAAVGTGTGGAIGLTFGAIDNLLNLSLRLSAAESSGMLRIVSSPRILTLDNREARISQGTLIPFAQVSAQGVQTTFQEAKLQLLVRPHVTADGSVSMHVKINRDEPDFNQTSARGDPTILKREAETDLLVMDGHTAVIGGIYTRNTGRNLDQVPFFGDIPILGVLFQRRRASDSRNELVIFLTPRIVNRAEALGR